MGSRSRPYAERALVNKWVTPACDVELCRLSEESGLYQYEILEALVLGFGQEGVDRAWEARESAEEARQATLEG
jgi:hypothetical protein